MHAMQIQWLKQYYVRGGTDILANTTEERDQNSPTKIYPTDLTKVQKQFNGGRTVFLINGTGTIRHSKEENKS